MVLLVILGMRVNHVLCERTDLNDFGRFIQFMLNIIFSVLILVFVQTHWVSTNLPASVWSDAIPIVQDFLNLVHLHLWWFQVWKELLNVWQLWNWSLITIFIVVWALNVVLRKLIRLITFTAVRMNLHIIIISIVIPAKLLYIGVMLLVIWMEVWQRANRNIWRWDLIIPIFRFLAVTGVWIDRVVIRHALFIRHYIERLFVVAAKARLSRAVEHWGSSLLRQNSGVLLAKTILFSAKSLVILSGVLVLKNLNFFDLFENFKRLIFNLCLNFLLKCI